MVPQPGQIWRHYKGGVYEIICMAALERNREQLVVYKDIHSQHIWARPLHGPKGFATPHDNEAGGLRPRFTLVSNRGL